MAIVEDVIQDTHDAVERHTVKSIWDTCDAVWRDPERLSGAYAFDGTRVPIYALFENINDGATVGDFLRSYPGVERWQVEQVLDCQFKRLRAVMDP